MENQSDVNTLSVENDNLSINYHNRAIKVYDVPEAFKKLPQNGTHEKFKHLQYFEQIISDHIQGYAQYQNNNKHSYLFTHNFSAQSKLTAHKIGSYLLRTDSPDQKDTKCFLISKDWDHCGGIQTMGRFILVPCESGNTSVIFFFDMEYNENANHVLHYDNNGKLQSVFPHRAASIGITNVRISNVNYYLLLVCAVSGTVTIESWCHVYIARDTGLVNAVIYSYIGKFFLKNDDKSHNIALDCQGIGLVTDSKDENVYLIALHSYMDISYDDWAFLFKLNIKLGSNASISADRVDSRHFKSKGGVSGQAGTHFRWGSGIHITPDGKLALLATSRNIIAGTFLDTNYWK